VWTAAAERHVAVRPAPHVEAHRILEETTIEIRLDLGMGDAGATACGSDLSSDYVRINADYRT